MNMRGARILITGGASGIGCECVRVFSELGAKLAVLDRDSELLAALPDGIRAHLGDRILNCDVGDEEAVEAAVEKVFSEFGGLDVLVNNAAILRDQTLVDETRQES